MGKKKKQTVGHKYYLGLVLVLAEKLEAIYEIKHGKKTAWHGVNGGSRISYSEPVLFGKDAGGIVAEVDFQRGDPTQPQNDYYKSWRGDTISALRGVASLVFRHFYFGNKPYLDTIEIKAGNIRNHYDDWYPDKAALNHEYRADGESFYIVVDEHPIYSNNAAATKEAVRKSLIDFINSLRGGVNSVMIVSVDSAIKQSIERQDCDDSDYDEIITFIHQYVQTAPNHAATRWSEAVIPAPEFFGVTAPTPPPGGGSPPPGGVSYQPNVFFPPPTPPRQRSVVIFVAAQDGIELADAKQTLDTIQGHECYVVYINVAGTAGGQLLDNTLGDGVPNLPLANYEALTEAVSFPILRWVDMNPAHMIRQWIIDPDRRGNGDPASIGSSFTEAADTLYSEGFGLSTRWQGSNSRKQAITDIERHIDGYTFKSSVTGLWEIKLVRDDFDPLTLPVFNGDNIVGWEEPPKRPRRSELPNSLTLTYTNRLNGEPASLTLTNSTSLSATGIINPSKSEFMSITHPDLAAKVLAREMKSTASPSWSGSFYASYADPEINRGSVFVLDYPEYGMQNVICRVTTITELEATTNKTLISFVEGDYDLGGSLIGSVDIPIASRLVLPSDYRLVIEVPYYLLVYTGGQSQVDADLATYPDTGYLLTSANQPASNYVDIGVITDSGAGYGEQTTTTYSPHGLLVSDLDRNADTTAFSITGVNMVEEIGIGTLIIVGNEFMRVDTMVLNGSNYDITVGRGCLDTVPSKHSAGDFVMFFQQFADTDEIEYLSGQTIDVKLLNRTGSGQLHISKAPTDTVEFNSRAVRPYPVGDFKANASYSDFDFETTIDVVLTWAHRDRLTQTTNTIEDHTHSNIGPEAGVSYQVQIRAVDSGGADLGLVVDTDVGTDTTYTFDSTTATPPTTASIVFSVVTKRGLYDSWQAPKIVGNTNILTGDFNNDFNNDFG